MNDFRARTEEQHDGRFPGHGDGTRCVHAGLPEPVPGAPFLPGPVFAAPYHLDPRHGPAAAPERVRAAGQPDPPAAGGGDRRAGGR